MILGLCSRILPKSLRSGLTVLLVCAALMVIFIWNELEKQDFLQQQDLRAKKAKEQDFNIALRRFDLHHGKKSPRKHPDENVENQKPETAKAKTSTEDPTTTTEQTTTTTTTKKIKNEAIVPQRRANKPVSPSLSRPNELVENGMDGCPAWYPDWDSIDELRPKIVLDKQKFLIPVLTYGPNNQLRGFRETIFLAIKLNRTVVPPPFYKHDRTDDSKDESDLALIIPPWHRLDLTALATAMTTLDPFFLSPTCNKEFDIFFKTKPFYCSGGNKQRFDSLFSYLGMEWAHDNKLSKSNGECHLEKTIPDNRRLPTNGGPIHLQTSKYNLESFYKSDESCALWIFPYHCIQFKSVLKESSSQEDAAINDENIYEEGDSELMLRIIRATPRPKYLRDIAEKYLAEVMELPEKDYLAIHWRYNHGDWLKHCEHKPSTACTAVLETIGKPVEIAQEIAIYLRARPHLKALYIAAPLEEADLIEAIRIELKDEFPIYTGETLLQFMLDAHPQCQWMKDNFHDIFSSLEQEICSESDTFLYAAGSSWSLNIVMERHAHSIDIDKSEENINLLYKVLRKIRKIESDLADQ